MKRCLLLMVLLVPATALFAVGGQEAKAPAKRVDLSFAVLTPAWAPHRVDSLFWSEMAKRTGVNLKMINMSDADVETKINAMIASKDLPDMMNIIKSIADNYGPQGAFLGISTYLDKYPNLKKYFSITNNPWIYDVGGELYGVFSPASVYPEWGWTWDKVVAARLGIPKPKTLDDWLAAWRKVKASDPDLIPILTSDIGFLQTFLWPAWGMNDGTQFKDGVLTNGYLTSRAKEMVAFMQTLYKEGLLNKDILTPTDSTMPGALATGKEFTILSYNGYGFQPQFNTQEKADAHEAIAPPKGPYGDAGDPYPGFGGYWGTAFPAPGKNVETALKFLDYAFSLQGTELSLFGVEGITFDRTADGGYKYTDRVKADAKTAGKDVTTYLRDQFNVMIGLGQLSPPKLFFSNEREAGTHPEYMRAQAIVMMNPVPPLPPIWSTKEESARLAKLNADINTYTGEWIAKFVTGQAQMSDWDTFVKGLKDLNVEEVDQIRNAGYARFLAKAGKQKGFVPDTYSPTKADMTGIPEFLGMTR